MNPDSRAVNLRLTSLITALVPAMTNGCAADVGGGIPEEGLHVTAEFEEAYGLTHFTVSSANDVPARDPTVWEVQGSNDGEDFTTIYAHDGDSFWNERLQVVLFEAGTDFEVQTTGYRFFRHVTFDTASNPAGAYFQIGEIEYFGDANLTPVDPKAKLTTTWGQHQKRPISANIGHFLKRKPESSHNWVWVFVSHIRLKPYGRYWGGPF